jgi:hypothetical protein
MILAGAGALLWLGCAACRRRFERIAQEVEAPADPADERLSSRTHYQRRPLR